MKAKWLILSFLVIFIAGALFTFAIIDSMEVTDVDIVAINDIVKTTERNWGHIEQGHYSASPQQFTIIDYSGNVLYQTDRGRFTTIHNAIKHRDTILDLTQNNTAIGKLIVHHEDKEMIQLIKKRLVIVLFLTFGVLAALCIFYFLFINHTVFKPFRKLQSFAVNVAKGNLEIPLTMDRNNPFGAFTESFDIMREELAAARHSEYASNRSKKELIASLSHDIKTPVSSIKAVSELMLIRATDEKLIQQINTIHSKAEQINLLVTDMFNSALEELQELKVTPTEEPSHILTQMIANVNDNNLIRCDPIPECIIITDVVRLQQVLDNVLSNSYKYAGTPVTITSQVSYSHLALQIMDYGKGISEQELPLIFNKFYRGKNVGGKSGSGLGLYISNYVMQNLQGDIECHNRDDGFTVTLTIKLA